MLFITLLCAYDLCLPQFYYMTNRTQYQIPIFNTDS